MRVMEMVTVHDLVEIDAGDVSAYDVDAFAAKAVREQAAADRIFGLLPADQQRALPAAVGRVRGACDAGSAVRERRRSTAAAPSERPRRLAEAGAARRSRARRSCDRMAPIESSLPDVWPHVLDVVESFCAAGVLTAGLAVLQP